MLDFPEERQVGPWLKWGSDTIRGYKATEREHTVLTVTTYPAPCIKLPVPLRVQWLTLETWGYGGKLRGWSTSLLS